MSSVSINRFRSLLLCLEIILVAECIFSCALLVAFGIVRHHRKQNELIPIPGNGAARLWSSKRCFQEEFRAWTGEACTMLRVCQGRKGNCQIRLYSTRIEAISIHLHALVSSVQSRILLRSWISGARPRTEKNLTMLTAPKSCSAPQRV